MRHHHKRTHEFNLHGGGAATCGTTIAHSTGPKVGSRHEVVCVLVIFIMKRCIYVAPNNIRNLSANWACVWGNLLTTFLGMRFGFSEIERRTLPRSGGGGFVRCVDDFEVGFLRGVDDF